MTGSCSRGPASPHQVAEGVGEASGLSSESPPRLRVCMAKGLRRKTPIMRRISLEAWVARRGTSVGGSKYASGDDRAEDGEWVSSMMKRLSGSSGSILTGEGSGDGDG
jgi:hypothetical protein